MQVPRCRSSRAESLRPTRLPPSKLGLKPAPFGQRMRRALSRRTLQHHRGAARILVPFQPVGSGALLPNVKARTEIDRFIAQKLEARGLRPVRPADRRTLMIRRASEDPHRPPAGCRRRSRRSRHDRSPEAFAKVIDRLLALPRYGERWGRLWLDVARYSDDRLDSERDNPYPASFSLSRLGDSGHSG